MKTTIPYIVLLLISGLIFFGVSTFVYESEAGESRLQSEIFSVDNGFGYTITYKGKTLISQKSIPAMEEIKPFCSENEASKVADLVIQKLKGNKSPTISQQELMKLEIRTNCLRQSE